MNKTIEIPYVQSRAVSECAYNDTTVTEQFTVTSTEGLHMRPAAKLVKIANGFASDIAVWHNSAGADAKSVINLVMLEAGFGAALTVITTGRDAPEAMASIAQLFSTGL